MMKGLAFLDQAGIIYWRPTYLSWIAQAHMACGEPQKALEFLDMAEEVIKTSEECWRRRCPPSIRRGLVGPVLREDGRADLGRLRRRRTGRGAQRHRGDMALASGERLDSVFSHYRADAVDGLQGLLHTVLDQAVDDPPPAGNVVLTSIPDRAGYGSRILLQRASEQLAQLQTSAMQSAAHRSDWQVQHFGDRFIAAALDFSQYENRTILFTKFGQCRLHLRDLLLTFQPGARRFLITLGLVSGRFT